MFTYFHQHKCRYDKGQIAPLMILALVILIIMAMVTVNLYKVAMDKTYSANSVDAGALAAGSVMANIFNALGSSNAEMKKGYETSYIGMATSVSLALIYLFWAKGTAILVKALGISAATSVFGSPSTAADFANDASDTVGSAIDSSKSVSSTISSLIFSVSALYAAQLYFYGKLRETAIKGRNSAKEQGHKFLFYNSGVGSRLPETVPGDSSWSKSRKDFSKFMDTIDSEAGSIADKYRFDWQDGQSRAHFVESTVTTQETNTFDLIVTMLPFPELLGLLIACRIMSGSATGLLTAAKGLYKAASALARGAEAAKDCGYPCTAAYIALCLATIGVVGAATGMMVAAVALMVVISILLNVFRLGLLPNRANPVRDDHMGMPVVAFIICWIDDLIHDRHLRVESVLSQEGGDLGLVKTDYPLVRSYSVVDFTGGGSIRPTPRLNFDPSIAETDVIGSK